MLYMREFEVFEDEGMWLALPFGMEGGTQGLSFEDAVAMAAEWLHEHALHELSVGGELKNGSLGNAPAHNGTVVTVAVQASLAEVPAMTAADAAAKLGVSTARVAQLCAAGELDSWKVGRTRMVSEESVEYRLATKPRSGRPARARKLAYA